MTKTVVAEKNLSQHSASRSVQPASLSIQNLTLITRQPAAAPEIEAERARATEDFLRDHRLTLFAPYTAPFDMTVAQDGGHFAFSFHAPGKTEALATVRVTGATFKPFFRDYALICDNFYKTARAGDIHRLETLDAGRKALHDEAGENLQKAVKDVFFTDLPTARRLFTLIYVLHMRGIRESALY